jgi:hypothetical protein
MGGKRNTRVGVESENDDAYSDGRRGSEINSR